MYRLFIALAFLFAGCGAPSPSVPLSAEHEKTLRDAIADAGFANPSFIELKTGVIEIQYHAVINITPTQAESLAMGAVKAARNALYVAPGANKSWWYNVTIWNPAPGPDMQPVFMGSAFMTSNVYRWSPA